MNIKLVSTLIFATVLLGSACGRPAETSDLKRVYRDITPGEYATKLSLEDCQGETLLSCMKKNIYPALTSVAAEQPTWNHINGVRQGKGVELQLVEGITTFHVGYKMHGEDRAERSGRSFSAVGLKEDGSYSYVADASYAHYFDSFEKQLEFDTEFLKSFYAAILGVIVKSDASAVNELNEYQQRLVADFVAVYIAEQYRHLLGGEGESLGRSHRWDNALLQTTMLLSFHAGQEVRYMYYKNSFTSETYDQYSEIEGESFCAYSNWDDERRDQLTTRSMQLRDYWQPNATCDRSGVNITRRDFEKLGQAISTRLAPLPPDAGPTVKQVINEQSPSTRITANTFKNIAEFFISNAAPDSFGESGDGIVSVMVTFMDQVRQEANAITEAILADESN